MDILAEFLMTQLPFFAARGSRPDELSTKRAGFG
jgi:hypothetical protein